MNTVSFVEQEVDTHGGRRLVLVRHGGKDLPVIVMVHGYGQSGWATWEQVAQRLASCMPNTVIVVERLGRNCEDEPKNIGRMTVGEQVDDLGNIVSALGERGIIGSNQRISWVTHSLGDLLARTLILRDPRKAENIVSIAPVPITPLAICLNPVFWVGGLIAVPAVLWSVLTGRGVHYPRWVVRWLFVGDRATLADFENFFGEQEGDSGWIFLQVLLFYGWGQSELQQARRNGWRGYSVVVRCRWDRIMSSWAMRRMVDTRHAERLANLRTAHCWWVERDDRKCIALADLIHSHINPVR
jgi:pimeloyl-ACP methyl ester carboxylesterase